MSTPASLIEHFSRLEDPRVERNKKHELIDVIVLKRVRGAQWGGGLERHRRVWAQQAAMAASLCRAGNGIPVDDTIARIISALSVTGFQECFMSWMEDAAKLSRGEIIALDGKTQRRSYDRRHRVSALPMVSAWACRNAVVLGQVKTRRNRTRGKAIPELLAKLELCGGDGPPLMRWDASERWPSASGNRARTLSWQSRAIKVSWRRRCESISRRPGAGFQRHGAAIDSHARCRPRTGGTTP